MRPEVVAFDLDGTLIDSLAGLTAAVNAARRAHGLGDAAGASVERWIGHGTRNLVTHALTDDAGAPPQPGTVDEAHATFVAAYGVECERGSTLRPGARECLQCAADLGIPAALTTNKLERFARRIVDHLGIAACFTAILGGDSGERKPSPWMLREAARRCGADVSRGLLIGDSMIDVESARAAGWPVWIIAGGYGAPASCPVRLASLGEAADRLRSLRPACRGSARATPGAS